jgi:ABC-type spermidine/putrescine transport system permease subunit II
MPAGPTKMNRAIYIIMIPVVLIALGYIFVFRAVGLAPGYGRLLIAMALFVGAAWWLVREQSKGSHSTR